jgi:secreted trypsin-like serine protease
VGEGTYHELKQTQVKVVGNCQEHWRAQIDEDKQICVGDVTTGDSGGPMLYEHNWQWVVVGVTSFVQSGQCSTSTQSKPNVYARVSAYLPWIKSII